MKRGYHHIENGGLKPIGNSVLLDCDGVLADFSTSLLKAVGSSLTAEGVDDWDIFNIIEKHEGPDMKADALDVLDDFDFWANMDLMPGAESLYKSLGAPSSIHIVTSPWMACHGWESARRWWLNRHFGIDPRQIIITEAKFKVVGDTFIDDKESHVREWRAAHPNGFGILRDAPYNRHVTDLPRLIFTEFF